MGWFWKRKPKHKKQTDNFMKEFRDNENCKVLAVMEAEYQYVGTKKIYCEALIYFGIDEESGRRIMGWHPDKVLDIDKINNPNLKRDQINWLSLGVPPEMATLTSDMAEDYIAKVVGKLMKDGAK